MAKITAQKKFILGDISKDPITGDVRNKELVKHTPFGDWAGWCLVGSPFEGRISIDFTGPPGAATGIYYSLAFQMGKWEYNLAKMDEWIEVSPVHAQYYQLTHRQKEELETKIKAGLTSVSQSVADYELLLHDLRKYEEMLHYLGYKTKDGGIDFSVDDNEKTKKRKEVDNHALRAMFIDQVDIHTGEGISMRSIVSRWPTLISDFQKMDDRDTDVDRVKKKLDISRAESVILVTKNKLYHEWKNLFLPVVVDRYKRIGGLAKSREKSINEYKEWMKPVIARHQLITEGLATESGRNSARSSFITGMGHAISASEITLLVWKDFIPVDIYKIPSEAVVKEQLKGKLSPYDDWTKKNLIFNKEYGLIVEHPWITDDWVKEKLNEFQNPKGAGLAWMPRHKMYYSMFVIKFNRTNMRSATGEELEDGIFDVNFLIVSQNAMFAKLLELEAKKEEFNRYVNDMLGIPAKPLGVPWKEKEKTDLLEPAQNVLNKFSLGMQFMKRGPYERDFDERISKYYLAPAAVGRFIPIVNFIKNKMGYGQ